MATLSTSSFEHDFPGEEFRSHRRETAQELFGVLRIMMIEVLPFPAKLLSRRRLIRFNLACLDKARDGPGYRITASTRDAFKLTFDYFVRLGLLYGELFDFASARRTSEVF